jgi:hypothetical protein
MLDHLVLEKLGPARRVLVAGCGGGYDVLGAIPLRHALRAAGLDVHLASLSFAYLNGLANAEQDGAVPNLYAVGASAATTRAYCGDSEPHVVWSFDKTGVRPLVAAYRALIERLHIDAIILVDGGVDAVLRGDETSLGTPSEDLASLAAATSFDIPVLLACVGMTAELRDGIAHAQVFERIAELATQGAYLGASALVPGTAACDVYTRAVEAVFAGQAEQKQSHVHRVITRSVRGEFGATGPHVWLSPLASMFWFFDAHTVARTHHFLDELRTTDSIWDVAARIEAIRKSLAIKQRSAIPI